MMKRRHKKGFTLVELAIVLAVSALLFAGLWRLFSGGNTQIRDQAAADQINQLAQAAKGFLASEGGRTVLLAQAAGTSFSLPLPTSYTDNNNCRASIAAAYRDFCDFLPIGFTNATSNSYGQIYQIRVLQGPIVNPATTPQTYSFLILTSGGDVISDTSGARIAGSIGNDGGFVYTRAACSTQPQATTFVCGAYGGWTTTTGTYNFAGAWSGHIGYRFASAGAASTTDPWLARIDIGGPTNAASGKPDFNTIQADTYMDGTHLFDLRTSPLYGNGGSLNQGISLTQVGKEAVLAITGDVNNTDGKNQGTDPNCDYFTVAGSGYCHPALFVSTNVSVGGLLTANVLYAESFIYQGTSDMRFKNSIKPIDSPLEKMAAIRGLQFRMNGETDDKTRYGVVAQDVEKVYPDLVGGTENHKTVDYMGLIGPIIGAVNELKAENDALRTQVKDQAAAIKRLEEAERAAAP